MQRLTTRSKRSKVRIGCMIVLAFVAASGVVAAIVSPILRTAGDPEGGSLFRVVLLALGAATPGQRVSHALLQGPALFGRLARGRFLHPDHGKNVRPAGHCLVEAGVAAIAVAPGLEVLAQGGDWRDLELRSDAIGLIGLGAGMGLISRVLDVAAKGQAEDEAIV